MQLFNTFIWYFLWYFGYTYIDNFVLGFSFCIILAWLFFTLFVFFLFLFSFVFDIRLSAPMLSLTRELNSQVSQFHYLRLLHTFLLLHSCSAFHFSYSSSSFLSFSFFSSFTSFICLLSLSTSTQENILPSWCDFLPRLFFMRTLPFRHLRIL